MLESFEWLKSLQLEYHKDTDKWHMEPDKAGIRTTEHDESYYERNVQFVKVWSVVEDEAWQLLYVSIGHVPEMRRQEKRLVNFLVQKYKSYDNRPFP